MVVIDATMLMLLIQPETRIPNDKSGKKLEHARERVEGLIDDLEKARVKVLIPTPALSEVLVRAGALVSEQIVETINKLSVFRIEPFDARAAIELATMTRRALEAKGKKKHDTDATWAKLKYDRQIVAIAKVNQATTIYSDDHDIKNIAEEVDINVIGLAELPVPAGKQQRDLFKDATPE